MQSRECGSLSSFIDIFYDLFKYIVFVCEICVFFFHLHFFFNILEPSVR